MISEQSLLTDWLAGMLTNFTDCQSHFHVCLIIESTSVWSYRAGVNLSDVANYQS